MIALTWDDVDWARRTLTIRKTMEFRYKRQQFWVAGPPKSMSSYRTIPLTGRAYEILREVYATKNTRKHSPEPGTVLEYADKRKEQKQKKSFNREPRKICVKENKRQPFSQESEQERNLIERM